MNGQGRIHARTRELHESVVIAAPPEEVFAVLSDVRRMPEWSPECVGVRILFARGNPGPVFLGFNRNGHRRWFTFCRVTRSVAPEEFVFRVSIAGLPLASWGFLLRPADDGGTTAGSGSTHITQYWHDLRRGGRGRVADLLGRAAAGTSPAARVRTNRFGMVTTLRRLKQAVEAASGR
ncbi:SRPBCC family protein [Streptomyces bikiniensis]|uniref:SRPBCC family protein n=1 Tax=Streptomyces bikiniensis TaxID=1896 RepID=UPI00068BB818|nr:SRPBCC family protein [Streptomyces bikiniensis]